MSNEQLIHTPTPWEIADYGFNDGFIILSPKVSETGLRCLRPVADIDHGSNRDQKRVDSEFIVRACNNHEKLLEALKDILSDHDVRMEQYPDRNNQPNRIAVMERAREVITKVEGGKTK